ncbi:hypothetical protein ATJ88_2313 [Isoptericola jiangsuensis]|uniref:CopC domain-containing protein n=1 Tax=Isoptericola jiangsuensis TaxID=548579 RepID=A0A2A9EWU7_9MICO|nr:copper resistance CopC family protein [Isoptericola jiangsuensis]PFG43607.1 hypothetical protein ATJ88_2313 [Isoptericola jiangsuensis]
MHRTRALAGVVAGVVALLATAAPASAHDELISSDPSADTVLDAAPDEVSLTFSDELLDLGAVVVVADAAGDDWAAGPPVLDGDQVTVPVTDGMPDAGYEVRWRIVSADGHPISGVVPFVVGDSTPLDRAGAPPAGDDASPSSGTAAPSDSEDDTIADAVPADDAAATTTQDDGPGRVLLVGAGGALLALAVLLLVSRSRRRDAAAGPDATPADASSAAPSDSPERH